MEISFLVDIKGGHQYLYTVNVEILAQYIFSCISRRALYARKFDVSENYYHNRTNRINWYMGENLAARKYVRLQHSPLPTSLSCASCRQCGSTAVVSWRPLRAP